MGERFTGERLRCDDYDSDVGVGKLSLHYVASRSMADGRGFEVEDFATRAKARDGQAIWSIKVISKHVSKSLHTYPSVFPLAMVIHASCAKQPCARLIFFDKSKSKLARRELHLHNVENMKYEPEGALCLQGED